MPTEPRAPAVKSAEHRKVRTREERQEIKEAIAVLAQAPGPKTVALDLPNNALGALIRLTLAYVVVKAEIFTIGLNAKLLGLAPGRELLTDERRRE